SAASSLLWRGLTSRARSSPAKLIAFPARTGAAEAVRPDARSPRFRRAPFARDGVFDHGRATAPRSYGAAHIAFGSCQRPRPLHLCLSRLNSPPRAIAVYASRRSLPSAPQHSLPSARYGLLGPDSHRLDHASFAWRTDSAENFSGASRLPVTPPPAVPVRGSGGR